MVEVVKGLLNPAELRRIGASDDAEKSGDKTVVDGNIRSDVAINVALIDNIIVEVVRETTAELGDEVANESIVEEAIEGITEIVEELVVKSWVEIAIDCSVEVADGMIVTEEGARIVKSEIIDEAVVAEDDVGMALVETATLKEVARTVDRIEATEDGVGIALEERLSALMMSAAFARTLASCPFQQCEVFKPSRLQRIRQPVNVQLESPERFPHQQLSNFAYLYNLQESACLLQRKK